MRLGGREGGQLQVGLAIAWLPLGMCTTTLVRPRSFGKKYVDGNGKQDIETWLTTSLAELTVLLTVYIYRLYICTLLARMYCNPVSDVCTGQDYPLPLKSYAWSFLQKNYMYDQT